MINLEKDYLTIMTGPEKPEDKKKAKPVDDLPILERELKPTYIVTDERVVPPTLSEAEKKKRDQDLEFEKKREEYRKRLAEMIAEGRRLREAEEATRKEPDRQPSRDYGWER